MNDINEAGLLLKKAIYHYDRKEYEIALGLFNGVLKLDPAQKSAHFKVGEINYRLGRYDEAINELIKTVKLDEKNGRVYMVLGVLYREKRRYKEAIEELDKAFRLSYGDKGFESEVCNEKANSFMGLKKYDLALKEAKKALELNPANKYAYKLLGGIYNCSARYEEVLPEMQRALKLFKEDKAFESEVYMELANAYLGLKNYGLAEKEAQRALKLKSANKDAYTLLSGIYEETAKEYLQQGKYSLALEEAKKIGKLAYPPNKHAYRLMGDIYSYQRRYNEALKEFDKALELSEGEKEFEQDIKNSVANIYLEQGNNDQGIDELNRSMKLDQHNCVTRLLLGRAYKREGRYEEALNEFAEGMKFAKEDKKTESKLHYEITSLLESANTNNSEKAVKLAKKALKLNYGDNKRLSNALTNELEIAEKATRLNSKVRKLVVNLTNQCNLDCKMCFNLKNPKQELSKKIKKEILGVFPYLEKIDWLGGEVFLYPGFGELLDEAIKCGVEQFVITNGLLLNEELAAKFIKNNVLLNISLDATTKKVYEDIRRGAKFNDVLGKLDMINRVRKEVNPEYKLTLNVVVMRSNYQQIESFAEFARQHNFNTVNFMMISGNHNDQDIFNSGPDPETLSFVDNALDNARKACREYGIVFLNNITKGVLRTGKKDAASPQSKKCDSGKIMCFAPWKHLNVDIGGNVFPFTNCFCRGFIGNLNDESLEDIWNGKAMVDYRKQIIKGNIEKVCTLKAAYKEIPFELLK